MLTSAEITFTNSEHVVVISDLHLSVDEPAVLRAFLSFIDQILEDSNCGALLVLGDLFEVWVGDDRPLDLASRLVAEGFRAVSDSGRPVYMMHGNRDFLLGDKFCKRARSTLLPDVAVLAAHGQRIALCHGDTLCTDDVPYQAFRAQVRTPEWRKAFLAKPLAVREQLAQDMREASEANKLEAAKFSDVNADAVLALMSSLNVGVLIHGHTHEGHSHFMTGLPNWPDAQRHVTCDWHAAGGTSAKPQSARGDMLRITPNGVERHPLAWG